MTEIKLSNARVTAAGDGKEIAELWTRFLPAVDGLDAWLPSVVDELLNKSLVNGAIASAESGSVLGFGLSCFLRPATMDKFVSSPAPYFNLRLLERHRSGEPVFLAPDDQIAYNTGDGLDLLVLEYCQSTFDFEDPLAHEILNAIVPLYHEVHAGFNIRRTLHETEMAVGHIQEAGGNDLQFEVCPQHPHSMSDAGLGPRAVYGVSREDADAMPATGIAKVLLYHKAPEFHLTLREQAVIHCAFDGKTDAEIASVLGISRDGVRARWTGIYEHIEDVKPDFFEGTDMSKAQTTRGRERRRLTLSYLASRPQELRPLAIRRSTRP